MLDTLTFAVVLLVGAYLVALAATAFLAPSRAAAFLLGFARTARTHYVELALRGLAGGAFVWQGPQMRFSSAFAGFGWVLVLTTAGLTLVPWRWHRAFAQRAVPYAVRYPPLLGVAALLLGGLVLAGLRGGATERSVAADGAARVSSAGQAQRMPLRS
jgi:hypothetical protein